MEKLVEILFVTFLHRQAIRCRREADETLHIPYAVRLALSPIPDGLADTQISHILHVLQRRRSYLKLAASYHLFVFVGYLLSYAHVSISLKSAPLATGKSALFWTTLAPR